MYKIKPLKSARDGLYKTPGQKSYDMPPPGTMVVIGSTGSGKTNLVCTLLKEAHMLKDYYDKIYVFCLSPCPMLEEHVEQIKEKNIFLEDDPTQLKELYDSQKKALSSMGFKRTPHVLFILDDIVQSKSFLKAKVLTDIFFGGTHSKCSLWLLSQNYMSVPRRLRMNAHSLILCHGINNTEIERFTEEHQSSFMDKKEFMRLVKYALTDAYSFMFVNNTHPNKKLKYRRGFNDILEIIDEHEDHD